MLGLPCRYDASDNIIIKVLGNKYLKSRGAKLENHFAPTIAIKYSIPVNKKYFHKPSFFSLKYLFPLVLNKYITSNKSNPRLNENGILHLIKMNSFFKAENN
jgi:hypothetical protein